MEDTDQERHQESSVKSLLRSLEWLGLSWDEGLVVQDENLNSKGSLGPYRQKDRLSIYWKQAQKLLQEERAYYCFLTDEEIAQKRNRAIKEGRPFRFFSPYRHWTLEKAEKKRSEGEAACIRFKIPEDQTLYRVNDLVRGTVDFPADMAGDFIIIRSDRFPVYNFSCAVDDALMKITHVFRGEEHLSNTARQFMIQEALGFPHPVTGHLSLLVGPDKKKLSKRENAESVEYFKEEGFLPEALMNFLAFLGWNPGTEQEYFKKKQLVEAFSVKGLNASAAVFDKDKLLWLNSEHIKNMENKQLWKVLLSFFEKENLVFNSDPLWQNRVLEEMKYGFKTLRQAMETLKPLSKGGFTLEESVQPVLKWPVAKPFIKRWIAALEKSSVEYLSAEDFKSIQKQIQENLKGKEFFMPLRCAILGKPQGTELKTLVTLLERTELIRRANELLRNT